eukprot:518641-Pyramimonas_sp.AAC.1
MSSQDYWEAKSREFRAKGDEFFAEEKWEEAVELYTKAISALQKTGKMDFHSLGNRCASFAE